MKRMMYLAGSLTALGVLTACSTATHTETTQPSTSAPTPIPTGQALEECKEAIKLQVIGRNMSAADREQQFTNNYDFEHVTFKPSDGGVSITFEWNEKIEGRAAPIECVWTPTNVTAHVIK